MLINHIVWDINPEIFSLGPFSIRYYGVLWALSFYLGYIIFERFVKKEHLPEGYLDKLTIYMLIGTVVGARLGHCLFYQPAYYAYLFLCQGVKGRSERFAQRGMPHCGKTGRRRIHCYRN